MRMMSKQGMAPTKDLGEGVSGAAFLMPPRDGRDLAIYSRWYAMKVLVGAMGWGLWGCGGAAGPFVAPEAVEGGWKMSGKEGFEAEDWLKILKIRQAVRVRYEGPTDVEVEFYEMPGETAAFECLQKYRAKGKEDRFYKRNVFVVVRSGHPNREMMMDFSRALQKGL
jgi:hypothetical protein